MMKQYRERADRLLKRRQEDVKDQSLEYMPGRQQSLFILRRRSIAQRGGFFFNKICLCVCLSTG